MINYEFEIKINEIIKYLKKNNGYKYKLYNCTCSEDPDSNIVEYAEDIRDFWATVANKDTLYDFVILEIIQIIYDNIRLFHMDDTKLVKLKKYCKEKNNETIESTDYNLLIEFVHEALIDLLTANHLYDERYITRY